METFRKNKIIFIVLAIVVLSIFGYKIFSSGSSTGVNPRSTDPTAGGLVSDLSASPSDAIVGRDLLAMLARLQSITLDTSVFSDKAFIALVDKTRPIDPQPFGKTLGRRNPFSDFADGSGGIVSTTSQNQTVPRPSSGVRSNSPQVR